MGRWRPSEIIGGNLFFSTHLSFPLCLAIFFLFFLSFLISSPRIQLRCLEIDVSFASPIQMRH